MNFMVSPRKSKSGASGVSFVAILVTLFWFLGRVRNVARLLTEIVIGFDVSFYFISKEPEGCEIFYRVYDTNGRIFILIPPRG